MIEPHLASGGRCMYKTPFSHVNSSMRCIGTLPKYGQISCSERLYGHGLPPVHQSRNRTGSRYPRPLFVDISNETAAVKATGWRVATVPVRSANQSNGHQGHIIGLLVCESGGMHCRGSPIKYRSGRSGTSCNSDESPSHHGHSQHPERTSGLTQEDIAIRHSVLSYSARCIK